MRIAQAKKELEFSVNTFGITIDADILFCVVEFVSSLFNWCMILWMLIDNILVNSYLNYAVVENRTTAKTS